MSEKLTADQTWHALLDGQFSWDKDRKRYGIFQQSIAVKIVTPRLMELGHGMRVGLVEFNLTEILVFVISECGFAPSTRVVPNWKFQCSL